MTKVPCRTTYYKPNAPRRSLLVGELARFVYRGDLTSTEQFTLFIDAQNLYKTAREVFFAPEDSSYHGQINPIALADFICHHPTPNVHRILHEVSVYTGRPDSEKEPVTHAAHMRQCDKWSKDGAIVITRPLRYPRDWPNSKVIQKGIDVQIAIDFVAFAVDCKHDVGVLASCDTDLIPAIEFVMNRLETKCRVEIVGFTDHLNKQIRLKIPTHNHWCHWIDRDVYDSIADLTRYGRQMP